MIEQERTIFELTDRVARLEKAVGEAEPVQHEPKDPLVDRVARLEKELYDTERRLRLLYQEVDRLQFGSGADGLE